jgi:hypothetical protein
VPAAETLTEPNPARAYGYLLGSRDNFEADRAAVRAGEAAYGPEGSEARRLPWLMAAANRDFLARAVSWAAGQGAGQFLDLGAGLPVREPYLNTHEAAPGTRVAYVDSDPVVVRHSRLQVHGSDLACALADLRDPGAVLRNPDVTSVIDPGQPLVLILGMVLHVMDSAQAAEVVAAYVSRLAAGSVVIVSAPRWARRGLWRQVRDAYRLVPLRNHTRGDLAAVMAGLELVPPGICPAGAWRPGWQDCPASGAAAYMLGVAGRKP